jgi:hypothetical protein
MDKNTRSTLVGCAIIGGLLIIWSFFINVGKRPSPQNTIVIATVHKLTDTNGYVKVDVEYNYQGKALNNSFHIANADSLKADGKIRVLVSPENPGKDIKYIGVAK